MLHGLGMIPVVQSTMIRRHLRDPYSLPSFEFQQWTLGLRGVMLL